MQTKSFKDYILTATKSYPFRIKIVNAGAGFKEHLECALRKYTVQSLKEAFTVPVHECQLDFPQVNGQNVTIFEVTLEYPTTSAVLTEYLSISLGVNKQHIAVRTPNEPTEQPPVEKQTTALLNRPIGDGVKEHKFSDYFGSEYNASMIKELDALIKSTKKQNSQMVPQINTGINK